MKPCPKCGCKISALSRFCPQCGATLVKATPAVHPLARREYPEPGDEIISIYDAQNNCGRSMIAALRIITAIVSVMVGVAGVVIGVINIIKDQPVAAALWIAGGLVLGFSVFFIFCVMIIQYENISYAARNTETQYRVSLAQLELLRDLTAVQEENLRISREISGLLTRMDGDLFETGKHNERQTELLEHLLREQKQNSEQLAKNGEQLTAAKSGGDAIVRFAVPYAQKAQQWRTYIETFTKGCAETLTTLSERVRDALSTGPVQAGDRFESAQPVVTAEDAAARTADDHSPSVSAKSENTSDNTITVAPHAAGQCGFVLPVDGSGDAPDAGGQ